MAKKGDPPVQAVARRASFVAEMRSVTARGDPLDGPSMLSSEAQTSPMKRTSPPHIPSATAIAFRAFDTSIDLRIGCSSLNRYSWGAAEKNQLRVSVYRMVGGGLRLCTDALYLKFYFELTCLLEAKDRFDLIPLLQRSI